jgi:hypothetical protein
MKKSVCVWSEAWSDGESKKYAQYFVNDDGGREAAGYKGGAGDCAARAIAIATGISYQQAYDLINKHAKSERTGKRKRGVSNARTGVYRGTMHNALAELGWKPVACMTIGSGCKVHLRGDELPGGRIICNVSKHYVAVIDGVIHDTADPSRNGARCVYSYWIKS